MKRIRLSVILALLVLCAASLAPAGGAWAFAPWEQRIDRPDRDIVIVYTNDVHCAIDENIGYAGLASFRDEMLREGSYAALVDCGDMIQGGVLGMISSGDIIIDIMNAASYDIAILGNHEFDYGIPRLADLMSSSNAAWIGTNVRYTGDGPSPLPRLARYKIMRFGPAKVAFIGVSTPESVTTSTPRFFMDGGEYVWSFDGGSAKALYSDIQMAVEECRISGADYVILISHMGDSPDHGPYSSPEIVKNTWGIDAVIDGHDHHVIPSLYEMSKTGRLVSITSTGTQLTNIGRVVITRDGRVDNGLITEWADRDKAVAAKVAEIRAESDKILSQVIATSSVPLSIDEEGVRTVRTRENVVGDLAVDACRAALGSDVAVINGGAVRSSIPAGDIALRDVLSVMPFGANLCSVKAKGQQIIDALEIGARYTERDFKRGGAATGESGGFLQVSNIKYTIDTSVESTVETNSYGAVVGIKGARRVSDVQIRRASGWEPIDPAAEYIVGGTSYVLKESGDGNTAFAGCEVVTDSGTLDYMALTEYIRDVLAGDLSSYSKKQGLITVK